MFKKIIIVKEFWLRSQCVRTDEFADESSESMTRVQPPEDSINEEDRYFNIFRFR